MPHEAKVFIGYFRRNLASQAIRRQLTALCPELRGLEIKSKSRGIRDQLRYCCVSFDSRREAESAVRLLSNSTVMDQRLIARAWKTRNAANDRRNPNAGPPGRSNPARERRRTERRAGNALGRRAIEGLLAARTPGRWAATASPGLSTERLQARSVESIDAMSGSSQRICEVARDADLQLIAMAPQLAGQCLSTLEQLAAAQDTIKRQERQLRRVLKEQRTLTRHNRLLKRLYADSIGFRLFLLSALKNDRQFRGSSKAQLLDELKKIAHAFRATGRA